MRFGSSDVFIEGSTNITNVGTVTGGFLCPVANWTGTYAVTTAAASFSGKDFKVGAGSDPASARLETESFLDKYRDVS